jgi:hypothetical protein
MLLKRPNGCKLAQKLLDTVWGPDGFNTSSGRDRSIVRTADRELGILLTYRQKQLTSL